jgi:diguanylate cyclase (GGDEF)-like protein
MQYIALTTRFDLPFLGVMLGLLVLAAVVTPPMFVLWVYRRERRGSGELIRSLTSRTQVVDHLLDFSQTLQGAGRPQQVLASLAQFLFTQLNLSGVAIIESDPDRPGGPQVKAALPATLIGVAESLADLDDSVCPCIRQNLPRHFGGTDAPVRCAIDTCITLPPSNPAYCIPMQIGARTRILLHMLLPVAEPWTETRRQLAQTYANTAQSALVTLHLLAEAEQRTMTDPLTGLYNRRSMESLMEREVALAERHQRPLSLVMIDLDHFKNVNDAHGHAAGDHLLRSFADCVRMTLRKTDLAFRYGGDEFVIALPQTPLNQAQQVVQKLRQAFAAVDFSSAITRLDQQPTLSIGLAERNVAWNILSLSSLISAADQALYDAKAANRNCVRTYTPPKAA